jgi:hypothetical protein
MDMLLDLALKLGIIFSLNGVLAYLWVKGKLP